MRDILVGLGVEPARILLEDKAHDTLSSIYLCKAILAGRADVGQVIVCTSPYHQPRCTLLFRLAGVPAELGDMPGDRPHVGWVRWLYSVAREVPATAWDAFLILIGRGRSGPESRG